MSHSGSKAANPRGVGTESPRKQCSSAVARLSPHTGTTAGAVDVDHSVRASVKTGASKGSCWNHALAKCAAQIVADAEAVANKMR